MKKLFFSAAALAALLFAGSCQRENLELNADGGVTYTITLPVAPQTKGEAGYETYDLYYEVYRTVKEADLANPAVKPLFEKKVPGVGATTTLSLNLLNDQDYTILFWANKAGTEYFNTGDLRNVGIKPVLSNNDDRDAFCGKDQLVNFDAATKRTVTLTRPFAQLNIATIVLSKEEAGYDLTPLKSYVKVSDVPSAYNVYAETAVDEGAPVEYDWSTVPTDTEDDTKNYISYNGQSFRKVAMNYIVVPESNVTVYYEIETANGTVNNTIDNVPLQPNYRTNIVGNLLTSNATYTVEILPGFEEEQTYVEIWDGVSVEEPVYNEETTTWTVDNGEQLAWLALAVNGMLPQEQAVSKAGEAAADYNKNQKIVLGDNINLGGNEWIPIGTKSKHFQGTFDGNGYRIENFKITRNHEGKEQAAFFGVVSGSPTIKNLTIENANIVYPGTGDFYAAALVGTAYGYLTITNVTVNKCEISGNNKVAGLLAHDDVMSSMKIENCHVLNSKISSLNSEDGGNVGGLVGLFQGVAKSDKNPAPYGEHYIKNSSVKNTVINGINSSNTGKRSNGEFVACVCGKDNQTLVIEDCEVSGNTFTQNEGVTYVSPYGVFVGGDRYDDRKGAIIVDGIQMVDAGLTKEDGVFMVSSPAALQTAVNKAVDGDVIKLLENITIDETLATNGNALYYTADKSFTIDLNGKTLTGETSNAVIRIQKAAGEENTITIKNGTVIAGSTDWSAISVGSSCESKVKVNLTDLAVSSQKANDMAIRARKGSEYTITRCNVTATNGAGAIVSGGGDVTLNEVNVSQSGVYNWNSVALGISDGAKMIVNSGTYNSDPQGNAKGNWVAYVMSSGGTLEINGGTFNGTVAQTANSSNACGLICADKAAVVNINGGTFNSNGAILDMRNNLGTQPNPVATLAGGVFSSNPTVSGLYSSNLIKLAEDFKIVEKDGVWKVVTTAVAKIGEVLYKTLAEAVAAVQEGETVVVLSGNVEEGTIKLPSALKNVTFLGEEDAVLKDMTISAADGNSYKYQNITFNGLNFDNSGILLTGWRNGEEVIEDLTITNCTFRNLDNTSSVAPVHINKDAAEAVKNFTFTNNVIDGATGGSKSGVYAQLTGNVVFTNNVINNVSFRPYVIQITTDDNIPDSFVVTGNTFSGSAAGRAQGLGSNASGTDQVNVVVSQNIFKDITNAQQICYWNFNPENTTTDLSYNYFDVDIADDPSWIYYNYSASTVEDLVEMGIYPIYKALNADGTIDTTSAYDPRN